MPHDPTKDTYNTSADTGLGSAIYPITPNDNADQLDDQGNYFKYVVTKTAGDVAVLGYENEDGDAAQIFSLGAGQFVPLRVRRVLAAGTTATVAGAKR